MYHCQAVCINLQNILILFVHVRHTNAVEESPLKGHVKGCLNTINWLTVT